MSELDYRFEYRPPTPKKVPLHNDVRTACRELSEVLEAVLPLGRERSLALTKIEEAMFWANAAIARSTENG